MEKEKTDVEQLENIMKSALTSAIVAGDPTIKYEWLKIYEYAKDIIKKPGVRLNGTR